LREHAGHDVAGAGPKHVFHSMASQMTRWLKLIRAIGA
jgi:hypothetical protein